MVQKSSFTYSSTPIREVLSIVNDGCEYSNDFKFQALNNYLCKMSFYHYHPCTTNLPDLYKVIQIFFLAVKIA